MNVTAIKFSDECVNIYPSLQALLGFPVWDSESDILRMTLSGVPRRRQLRQMIHLCPTHPQLFFNNLGRYRRGMSLLTHYLASGLVVFRLWLPVTQGYTKFCKFKRTSSISSNLPLIYFTDINNILYRFNLLDGLFSVRLAQFCLFAYMNEFVLVSDGLEPAPSLI